MKDRNFGHGQQGSREFLFSVGPEDFHVTAFSVGGAGGSGKDTANTGVRIVHRDSGAVGEGREHRSQRQNKVAALRRLAATKEFKAWVKREAARLQGKPTIEQQVERWMDPANLLVEVRNGEGRWEKLK